MTFKKIYRMGEIEIHALRDVNFRVEKGGVLRRCRRVRRGQIPPSSTSGRDGYAQRGLGLAGRQGNFRLQQAQLTEYRRYDIGFVFQFYNLVQNLTALENVELAAQICRDPLPAATVLEEVGLRSAWQTSRPSSPAASSSAWPSPELWPKTRSCSCATSRPARSTTTPGKAVLKLLQDTCRQSGVTVIVITHNQAITAMADPHHHRQKRHDCQRGAQWTTSWPVEQIEW